MSRNLFQGQTTSGATVTIYWAGTTTKPTIYRSNTGASISNPITANFDGTYAFWIADGHYKILNGSVAGDLNDVRLSVTTEGRPKAEDISVLPFLGDTSTTLEAWRESVVQSGGGPGTTLGSTMTGTGAVGAYTLANQGMVFKDGAGNETGRIFFTDPNSANFNSLNTYFGFQSGNSQPTDNTSAGYYNTGAGASTLAANTTGARNTAIGYLALTANTDGTDNTAIGEESLNANIHGIGCTAIGGHALFVSTGDSNTGIGWGAGGTITTGTKNLCVGYTAGYGLTTGSSNTIIGAAVGITSSLSNNIILADGDGNIEEQFASNEWFFPGAAVAHGGQWVRGFATEELTLSTSTTHTDTSANLLPANAIIKCVTGTVTQAIATATDWDLADTTTAARFASANATLTLHATSVGLNHMKGSVTTDAAGPTQASAGKVRINTTGTPSAGKVRITVHYERFIAPTS